jgi:hypothetical protein
MADLITVADLKTAMKLDGTTGDDAYFTALVARVSDVIKRYCGMYNDAGATIDFNSTTVHTRIIDGRGMDFIVLPQKNVKQIDNLWQSIDRVFDATTLIAAADRFLDGPSGILYLDGDIFFEWPQSVKVEYVLNWSGVPDIVKEAAIIQCAYEWNVRKNHGVESKSLPDGSVVFAHATGLVKHARELLMASVANYRGIFG